MALLFFLNAKIELFRSLIREPQLYYIYIFLYLSLSRPKYTGVTSKVQSHSSKIARGDRRLFAGICKSARSFFQPAPILDFIWYPTATPLDPASFCFVASVRECPVKLLDASDGRVRFLISLPIIPGLLI